VTDGLAATAAARRARWLVEFRSLLSQGDNLEPVRAAEVSLDVDDAGVPLDLEGVVGTVRAGERHQ
jgi:hypothetical protein